MNPEDITIAVTAFDRRRYIEQALGSALGQTVPVRVIVVENCGPDPDLQPFVLSKFASRITYHRNAHSGTMFYNWNQCLSYCPTPWVSILHDDDFLAPRFVESLVDLSRQAPDCGLYFGQTKLVNEQGEPFANARPLMTVPWRRVQLADTLSTTPFPFPGHVFRVADARAVGGFREFSQFCGDWEMWSNLIAHSGGAQTSALVAFSRSHASPERGCSKMDLSGRLRPLVFVQQKRVLRMLRESGQAASFDRAKFLKEAPMSVDYLIKHAAHLPPRMLRYNVGLLLRSTPPSARYAMFQGVARVLGVRFVKAASWLGRFL
jgi:hypothetical protein